VSPAGAQPRGGRRVVLGAALVGVVGAALVVLGVVIDPRQAASSYLAAYVYWLSLALGALLVVMIHHLTDSTWFIVLRRLAEAVALPLAALLLLFLPLLAGLRLLYPWMTPGALPEHLRALAATRAPYLNGPFFAARALAYLAVFAVVSQLLWRSSTRQDAGDEGRLARQQRRLSAAAMPAVGLALTFAAFDWIMSLSPELASSVFGVYYFAGSMVGALALLAVLACLLQRDGRLAGVVGIAHYHALGKLLFTFVIFWAYIAFAQFFLIWIADIPREADWYIVRLQHGWWAISVALLVGHFVIPFGALLSRRLKRTPAALAAVGAWLLVMHYVDVYWLVLPALHADGLHPHWLDLAALAAVGGIAVACAAWGFGRHPESVRGDPRLARSLAFETR
jgi:hypothetical protein